MFQKCFWWKHAVVYLSYISNVVSDFHWVWGVILFVRILVSVSLKKKVCYPVLSLTRACKFKFELCTTVPHTVMCTLMTLKRSEHTHDGHSETPNNSFQQLHLLCVSLAHSPTHTHTHKLYSLGSSGTGTKRPPVCSVKSQTSLSRKVLTTLILDVLVSLSYLWLNVPRVS